MAQKETLTVNMGPQHPSTHGVLRLVVELDGEKIEKITPDIGYLHRGVEKLSEHRTYHQAITLTDRLDYLAPMSNNLGYVLAVEKLLGIEVPERAQLIRVIMTELTRLKSHLVWIACHALDIGAMTVFLYAFREREMVMSIYEKLSGARMTSNYFRVGGLSADVYDGFEKDVREIVDTFPAGLTVVTVTSENGQALTGTVAGGGLTIRLAASCAGVEPLVHGKQNGNQRRYVGSWHAGTHLAIHGGIGHEHRR